MAAPLDIVYLSRNVQMALLGRTAADPVTLSVLDTIKIRFRVTPGKLHLRFFSDRPGRAVIALLHEADDRLISVNPWDDTNSLLGSA
jgi:hypothetical protein